MYEDLLSKQKVIEKKVKEALDDEICPVCGSNDVASIAGRFVMGNYVQDLICIMCSHSWFVTYDRDLNIMDTSN